MSPVPDVRRADNLIILETDLQSEEHCQSLIRLIDAYRKDPMGGGLPPLAERSEMVLEGLKKHPGAHVFLCKSESEYVAAAVCFVGFSTFQGRILLNIHDLFVLSGFRGVGIGRLMLQAIEQKAKALGCCQLTLEVRRDNNVARNLYLAFGFGEDEVPMDFWVKKL